nr:hypothetical protein [bacterium]
MKMRQVITAMVACGILLSTLVGCAGPETSPDASATPTAEPSASASPTPGKDVRWPSNIDFGAMQGKSITTGYDFRERETEAKIAEEFERKFGVGININIVPGKDIYEVGDIYETMKYLVSTDHMPTIWYTHGWPWDISHMPMAAALGAVQPIDSWYDPLDTTFISSVMELNKWRGKRYVLQIYQSASRPKEAGLLAVTYNLTKLNAMGLEEPLDLYNRGEWSWDVLRQLSKQFNQLDASGKAKAGSKGLVVRDALISAAIALNSTALYKEVDNGYKLALREAGVQEILNMFADAVREGDFIYPADLSHDESAVFQFGSWTNAQNGTGDKYQAVPLPVGSFAASPDLYCVSEEYFMIGKNAPNPDIGYAFLWYLGNTVPEANAGRIDFDVNPFFERYEHAKKLYAMFDRKLEHSDQMVVPNIGGIPGMAEMFHQMCDDLYRYGMGMTEALDLYEQRMQKILDAFVQEYCMQY